jgi:hypothetical protein
VNDFEMMCRNVRPPTDAALAAGRRRLLAGARPRRYVRRPAWLLATTATVTATAAVATTVALLPAGGGHHQPDLQKVTLTSATQVLGLAAAKASQTADLHPRGDQYIEFSQPGFGKLPGGHRYLSVDGTRENIFSGPCPRPGSGKTCTSSLGRDYHHSLFYYRTLPIDPAALRRTLPADDHRAWKAVTDDLLDYLPPKLRAAMLNVLAALPATHLDGTVPLPTGGEGIGISGSFQGLTEQLVFDKKTFQFVGDRAQERPGGPFVWEDLTGTISVTDTVPPKTPDNEPKPA